MTLSPEIIEQAIAEQRVTPQEREKFVTLFNNLIHQSPDELAAKEDEKYQNPILYMAIKAVQNLRETVSASLSQ